MSVILSRPPLHPALVIQKRRALGEEHRKSTQGRIFQGIALVVASPSLVRLIERFWKLAKRCCLHARSYPTFQDFKTSILHFIETAHVEKKQTLKSLLTFNFQSFKELKVGIS